MAAIELGCHTIRDDVWHRAAEALQTEGRLLAAGFAVVSCWLQAWPVTLDEPRAYLETVCLGPHLERLADDERERFLDAVMVRLGERPLLDYVRLNIVARRR